MLCKAVFIGALLITVCDFSTEADAQAQFIPCYPISATQPCQPGLKTYVPLGYQQISSPASATALTVPAGATIAEICVSTQAARYRDDGTAPTASVGVPVASGACFQYSGNLATIQFIQQVSGAVLDISYYR